MKSIFIGHFRPTQEEFSTLWNESIFVVDANVLLNLYRYSLTTKNELEKALLTIKENIFITHQAAKEFIRNRLNVTSTQAEEYSKAIDSIKKLLVTLSNKNRHPFLPDDELPKLKEYFDSITSILADQQKVLLAKLTNDEVLDFSENLFSGKTGLPFTQEQLEEIAKEGEQRYADKVPPGYEDKKKGDKVDPYRKYGDLIVWKQIIELSKSKSKPIIFITDDKKEDWWLEEAGKTIGPRPEIIEEFFNLTNQKIWMYTVERFIQEVASKSKSTVSQEVIEEIIKVSLDSQENNFYNKSPISTSQDIINSDIYHQEGLLTIRLNRSMKYATGTGKFSPKFIEVPELDVEFVDNPLGDNSKIRLSFGCGTVRDFNIHLKGLNDYLEEGDYVFKYKAYLNPTNVEDETHTPDEIIA